LQKMSRGGANGAAIVYDENGFWHWHLTSR
jgi:hypothetical protein